MSRVQKLEEAATVSAGQVVECDAAMLTKSLTKQEYLSSILLCFSHLESTILLHRQMIKKQLIKNCYRYRRLSILSAAASCTNKLLKTTIVVSILSAAASSTNRILLCSSVCHHTRETTSSSRLDLF